METRVLVGNLAVQTREHELHDLFSGDGRAVESVRILRDGESGRSRGFGFVEMAVATDIDAVILAMNGRELHGRALLVTETYDRAHPPQRSGRPLGQFGGRW
jgi:heterogeneous nuclear ribonucleoprotein A1/A3